MLDTPKLEAEIRDFFAKEFDLRFEVPLTDTTNLFDGYIDSFGFLKVIDWVEKFSAAHQIKVYPADLFAEGFLSVRSMADYLRLKAASA